VNLIPLLNKALSKRLVLSKTTNALRLVNSRGDGLDGLVIERYNAHFVIHIYRESLKPQVEAIQSWLVERFKPEYLILKHRISPDGRILDDPKVEVLLNQSGSKTIVKEDDTKFSVDLNDGINSGLFLDMRHNRKKVGELSKNKKVLNCFAYTCSFGVHCRLAGAQSVQNVDISAKALKRGEENYQLNGLTPQSQEFIRMDTETYFEKALKHQNFYDVIVLDPPSFARTLGNVFQIKKGLPKLLELSIKALKPQGILFVSTNYSGLTIENISDMVRKTLSTQKRAIKSLVTSAQDVDFPTLDGVKESHLAAVLVKIL
jgi:23S rRNA (cytosine1962-C5)-methyltransferase